MYTLTGLRPAQHRHLVVLFARTEPQGTVRHRRVGLLRRLSAWPANTRAMYPEIEPGLY